MKLLTFVLLLFFSCFHVKANELTFSPSKPIPNEVVQIRYDVTGTSLEQEGDFQMIAYLFSPTSLNTAPPIELKWKRENNICSTYLTTNENTIGVLIRILPKEAGIQDAGTGEGFFLPFYEADRGAILTETWVAKATAYVFYGNYGGIRREPHLADSLFQQVFKDSPNLIKNPTFRQVYLINKMEVDAETGEDLINQWTTEILNSPNPSSEELLGVTNTLDFLKKTTFSQKNKLKQQLLNIGKKKCDNLLFSSYQITLKSFQNTTIESWNRGLKKLIDLKDKGLKNQASIDQHCNQLVWINTMSGGLRKVDYLLGQIESEWILVKTYQTMMTIYLNQDKQNRRHDLAMIAYAKEGLSVIEEELKQPNCPTYLTERWYKKELQSLQTKLKSNKAALLFKSEQQKEALKTQEEICLKNQFNIPDLNEKYCIYLEEVSGEKIAFSALKNILTNNKGNKEMELQFRRIALATGLTIKETEDQLKSFKQSAYQKLAIALAEKMQEQAAPNFQLKNVFGEWVSLANLKGKVVVLDFWASWCGPCIASFPTMQKAVDAYAQDKEVVFYFIDTWERGNDKKTAAISLLLKEGYNFPVLFDTKSAVVKDFTIASIPTKIILDKSGNVVFRKKGFSEDKEKEFLELAIMIELAKNR